ncbi:hypothetical protein LTR10_000877 [Elasticomyces elasticus]|nr:hypothetical protein LTR10_000877 [Elasticomyces elasticus]
MLSLPLIPPTFDSTPILPTAFRPRPDSPEPPASTTQHNPQLARQLQQHRDEQRKIHNTRAPLALLAADEAAITARKAAIRNFGAYWIRPPGIPKTLQAMNEEEIERLEMEEQARVEQVNRDLQARQQLLDAQQEDNDPEAEEGERDLDDEIPDAPDTAADMSFNEESILEGNSILVDQQQQLELQEEEEEAQHAVELEEAELMGVAQDEEELGIERDLDDSVPEAGSYQHTDTELEESDSNSELQDSFAVQSVRRSARVEQSAQAAFGSQSRPLQAHSQAMGGLQQRMRAQVGAADALPRSPGSLHLSSSILESSFIGSSPVMQRGGHANLYLHIDPSQHSTAMADNVDDVSAAARLRPSNPPPLPPKPVGYIPKKPKGKQPAQRDVVAQPSRRPSVPGPAIESPSATKHDIMTRREMEISPRTPNTIGPSMASSPTSTHQLITQPPRESVYKFREVPNVPERQRARGWPHAFTVNVEVQLLKPRHLYWLGRPPPLEVIGRVETIPYMSMIHSHEQMQDQLVRLAGDIFKLNLWEIDRWRYSLVGSCDSVRDSAVSVDFAELLAASKKGGWTWTLSIIEVKKDNRGRWASLGDEYWVKRPPETETLPASGSGETVL